MEPSTCRDGQGARGVGGGHGSGASHSLFLLRFSRVSYMKVSLFAVCPRNSFQRLYGTVVFLKTNFHLLRSFCWRKHPWSPPGHCGGRHLPDVRLGLLSCHLCHLFIRGLPCTLTHESCQRVYSWTVQGHETLGKCFPLTCWTCLKNNKNCVFYI